MAFTYKIALIVLANILYASGLIYGGYHYRDVKADAEVLSLKNKFAEQRIAAEKHYSEQLSGSLKKYETWAQAAQQVNQQQSDAQQRIEQTAAELKKGIPYVIQKDNRSNADCFGIDGLQHYRQSLGY